MHKAILLLVEAHARVGNVAPSLITRVLEALVNVITQAAMDCFQQIPKFGTGGMLTVRSRPSFLAPHLATLQTGQKIHADQEGPSGYARDRVPSSISQPVCDAASQ